MIPEFRGSVGNSSITRRLAKDPRGASTQEYCHDDTHNDKSEYGILSKILVCSLVKYINLHVPCYQ